MEQLDGAQQINNNNNGKTWGVKFEARQHSTLKVTIPRIFQFCNVATFMELCS